MRWFVVGLSIFFLGERERSGTGLSERLSHGCDSVAYKDVFTAIAQTKSPTSLVRQKRKCVGLAAKSLSAHRYPLASGPLWRPLKITAVFGNKVLKNLIIHIHTVRNNTYRVVTPRHWISLKLKLFSLCMRNFQCLSGYEFCYWLIYC